MITDNICDHLYLFRHNNWRIRRDLWRKSVTIRAEEMMFSRHLKKTIFISVIGHLTVFSIFSFSFGNTIPKVEYASISFLGQFLPHAQVSQPITTRTSPASSLDQNNIERISEFFTKRSDTLALDKINKEFNLSSRYYLKPLLTLTFNKEKEAFIERSKTSLFARRKNEPVIIFHPLLPYSFTLYFQDRQVAHVELMFKIMPTGARNSIVLKRKVSSGNLEVDLLSMRYIWHYLFIQQTMFAPNNWQTVKIDLSTKED